LLQKTLSVVVPAFNEEEVITETTKRLVKLSDAIDGWQLDLVFVDDGSNDRTLEILRGLADQHPQIRVVCFARNFGHQLAVTAGIDHADGDYIAIIDADLQDPPELIPKMLKIALTGYDVVHGTRVSRDGEAWFKRASAKIFYRLMNALGDVELPNDTGDFRLISRRVADTLSQMRERHRYLRGMIPWLGYKAYQLEYERQKRFAGETKYPFKKMLRLAADAIISFSSTPLELSIRLGATTTLAGLLGLLYVIVLKLTQDVFTAGLTTVICLIIVFAGVQITLIGLIGVYVSRIFEEAKDRPLYVVSEIIETK